MLLIDTRAALENRATGSDPVGDWTVNNQERQRLHNSRTAQKAREQGIDIDIAMEADAPVMPPTDNKAQEIDDSYLLSNTELDASDFAPPLNQQKGHVWNTASQELHDWHFKVGRYEEDKTGKYFNKNWLAQNPKEVSQFGLEWGGVAMYSDMGNVNMLSQLLGVGDELPDSVAMSWLILLGEYDKLPSGTWAGTFRMMRHMFANPTTLGTVGSLSFIRNLAVRGGKKTLANSLRRRLWDNLLSKAGITGRAALKYGTVPTETALIGAFFDHVGQRARWDEEQLGPFQPNWQQTMMVAGAAGAVGGAIQGVVPAVKAGVGFVRAVSERARAASILPKTMGAGKRNTGDVTLGMGVGPTDDAAARAAPQDDISEIGFYSAVRRAVDALPQEKGTAVQMRQMIAKGEGVKPEEMAWIGLDDFLKGRKNVTKQEIMDFVDANQVEVKEVVLEPGGEAVRKGRHDIFERYDAGEISRDERSRLLDELGASRTRFDKHTLPGGENYREVALTLPTSRRMSFDEFLDSYKKRFRDNVADPSTLPPLDVAAVRKMYDDGHEIPLSGEHVARKKDVFQQGHFGEHPNVLAHIRLNDRTGPNGEKILFVEEIQSDWHKKGQKQGYVGQEKGLIKELPKGYTVESGVLPPMASERGGDQFWRVIDPQGNPVTAQSFNRQSAINAAINNINNDIRGTTASPVPDAPLKKKWHEMVFRRVARMAAEEDYDMIAWTPGKVQAERYDLSKHLDRIEYEPEFGETTGNKTGLYDFVAYDKDGRQVIREEDVPLERIEDLAGKEIAEKIHNEVGESMAEDRPLRPNWMRISSLDLEVGGEGMERFYDNIIKNYAAKFGKKFNAKVGVTEINAPDPQTPTVGTEVWALPVTKKMRDSLMQKGAPLFSAAPIAATGLAGEERTE